MTGCACSHEKAAAMTLTARSRTIGRRWRSESSAWRLGSSGRRPVGERQHAERAQLLLGELADVVAADAAPERSETTAATWSASRRPSQLAATSCSSCVSLIICPSPRRASSGGSRNPESSNSPSSSTPSASARTSRVPEGAAGGAAGVAVKTSPAQPWSASCASSASITSASSEGSDLSTSSVREHLADARLLLLDGLVELVDREVLRPRARAGPPARRGARAGPRRSGARGRRRRARTGAPRRRPRSGCTRG